MQLSMVLLYVTDIRNPSPTGQEDTPYPTLKRWCFLCEAEKVPDLLNCRSTTPEHHKEFTDRRNAYRARLNGDPDFPSMLPLREILPKGERHIGTLPTVRKDASVVPGLQVMIYITSR